MKASTSTGPRLGLILLGVIALAPLAAGCYWMGASCADVPDRDPWKAVVAGLSATMFTAGMLLLADLFYRITPLSAFVVTVALLSTLGFGGRLLMLSAIYRLRLTSALGVWGSAVLSGLILCVMVLALIGLGDTLGAMFL